MPPFSQSVSLSSLFHMAMSTLNLANSKEYLQSEDMKSYEIIQYHLFVGVGTDHTTQQLPYLLFISAGIYSIHIKLFPSASDAQKLLYRA